MGKVLVTGGGGFMGSHLVDRLLKEKKEVSVIDICKGIPENLCHLKNVREFHYMQANVMDKNLLKKLATEDYDTIFHLAAIVGVENYCKDPLKTVDVNVGGTRNIIDVALEKEIKVIFTSTSEVFGKNPNVPWSENSDRVLGPTHVDRWSYSTSKSLCEHMLFAVHKKYGLPIVVIRYFNAYGPRQKPIFVIPAMINKVLGNENPVVYDTGKQTRCFTFIEDEVEGTIRASEVKKAEGESFNLGNTEETTISDLAKLIVEVSGKNLKPKYVNTKELYDSYEDLNRRVPDVSKAKVILNWEASTALREGILKTYKWYQKNAGFT